MGKELTKNRTEESSLARCKPVVCRLQSYRLELNIVEKCPCGIVKYIQKALIIPHYFVPLLCLYKLQRATMKKRILNWMTITLMALVYISFAACGDDNDGGSSDNTGNLVGIWRRVYKKEIHWKKNSSGEWEQSSYQEKNYSGNSFYGYEFYADKTAYKHEFSTAYTTRSIPYKYNVENGHLYMLNLDYEDTDAWEDWGTIIISGDQFELSREGFCNGGEEKELEITRFKKG